MEQNLSQYKIFYEVAKAGNISKAAKELYISQPAISKAIGKLEDSLGPVSYTHLPFPSALLGVSIITMKLQLLCRKNLLRRSVCYYDTGSAPVCQSGFID